MTAKELVGNTLWCHGPSSITDQYGGQLLVPDIDITCEVEAELSKSQSIATHAMITKNKECKMICLDSLIDCTHYSNLDVMLHVTAYVLLFVSRLKSHRTDRSKRNLLVDRGKRNVLIEARDIKETEAVWIQLRCFEKEIQYLLTHKGACPILVHKFSLFLNDKQ